MIKTVDPKERRIKTELNHSFTHPRKPNELSFAAPRIR